MFWAGINFQDRTDLVFVENGSLNAPRYITEILVPHVQPALAAIGNWAVFMEDNARAHRAAAVNEYLEEVGIRRSDWPVPTLIPSNTYETF